MTSRAAPDQDPLAAITLEAWALTEFGYGHTIGTEIPNVSGVLAENFLNAYPEGSPHRQETEDTLQGYHDMDPLDPDYEATRRFIALVLARRFGPLPPETGEKSL
jgi:hypothetical protein